MARHATQRSARGRWLLIATAALITVTVVTLVAVVWPSGRTHRSADGTPADTSACGSREPSLRVVATSEVASVIEQAATAACVDVHMTLNEGGSGAEIVQSGAADVWVPDSRARAVQVGTAAATHAPSIATSPIVMVADSVADAQTLTQRSNSSWALLLQRQALAPLSIQIQDPLTSSVGLVVASVLESDAITLAGDKYTGLAATASALTDLPPTQTPDVAPGQLHVVESRMVPAAEIPQELTPNEGLPQLDFPWVDSSKLSPSNAATAALLLKSIQGRAGAAARKAAGLQAPAATTITIAGASHAILPAPPIESIPTLYALSDAGALHGNDLAVVDVSGSMADPASSTGGPSKMDVLKSSASLALGFLSGQTSLGLWLFGYKLTPATDYQEIAPLAPLDQNRPQVLAALASTVPQQTGTGLYDTVLAAYQYMQAHWKAGTVNAIALFTDGRDEDAPGGLTLDQTVASLGQLADPHRPIQLLCFGYGDADIPSMQALTGPVGGEVYKISTPPQLAGAFVDAIAKSALATSI